MGQKATHRNVRSTSGKRGGKKEGKVFQEKTLTATINLHKGLHKSTFKKKAPNAVKKVKELVRRTMYTQDVRLDQVLNQHLWRNGIRNLDRRLNIVMERKKNENEDAKEKFYTLVKLNLN